MINDQRDVKLVMIILIHAASLSRIIVLINSLTYNLESKREKKMKERNVQKEKTERKETDVDLMTTR